MEQVESDLSVYRMHTCTYTVARIYIYVYIAR